MSYDTLMPQDGSSTDRSAQNWKAIKRELAALDILSSDFVISPEEFVKTKHNCYIVKEYANGGSVAQLLLYRSQVGGREKHSPDRQQRFNKRLSEKEMQKVISDLLQALRDLYSMGLGIWDLSPETLLLSIGTLANVAQVEE